MVSVKRKGGMTMNQDPFERAKKYCAVMDGSVSGSGGHNAAYRAACMFAVGFDLSKDQVFELLEDFNMKCAPKWSEKELRHKLKQAFKEKSNSNIVGFKLKENKTGWNSNNSGSFSEKESTVKTSDRIERKPLPWRGKVNVSNEVQNTRVSKMKRKVKSLPPHINSPSPNSLYIITPRIPSVLSVKEIEVKESIKEKAAKSEESVPEYPTEISDMKAAKYWARKGKLPVFTETLQNSSWHQRHEEGTRFIRKKRVGMHCVTFTWEMLVEFVHSPTGNFVLKDGQFVPYQQSNQES